jgi:hypothetical protein
LFQSVLPSSSPSFYGRVAIRTIRKQYNMIQQWDCRVFIANNWETNTIKGNKETSPIHSSNTDNTQCRDILTKILILL